MELGLYPQIQIMRINFIIGSKFGRTLTIKLLKKSLHFVQALPMAFCHSTNLRIWILGLKITKRRNDVYINPMFNLLVQR